MHLSSTLFYCDRCRLFASSDSFEPELVPGYSLLTLHRTNHPLLGWSDPTQRPEWFLLANSSLQPVDNYNHKFLFYDMYSTAESSSIPGILLAEGPSLEFPRTAGRRLKLHFGSWRATMLDRAAHGAEGDHNLRRKIHRVGGSGPGAVATVMGIYQFVKLMMNNATITFRENYTVRSPQWMKDQEISSSADKWRLARCL